MKTLKTYNNFVNEGLLDIPSQILKVIRKFNLFKLIPKIKKALKEMPEDINDAFEYLCNLFNINPSKEEFMKHYNREMSYLGLKNENLDIDRIRKRWKREERIDKLKYAGKFIGVILAMIIIAAVLGGLVSREYEPECKEFLQKQGYENIKVIGWDPTSEHEHDITSMEFIAVDNRGQEVQGVVIVGGSVLFGETYQVKFK